MEMTGGNPSRRTESRLLDSAVRDAVGHVGMSGNSGNPSRRAESASKRLRSVVVGATDNPDLGSGANGWHHHLKPRLDISRPGAKVAPGLAVALKAAAAAAEDVNNNCGKARGRSSGSVWDRLGNRSSDRLGVKEKEVEEVGRVDADNGEVEDTWEDFKIGGGEESRLGKRPRWRKVTERLRKAPREEADEFALANELGSGSFGYLEGKRSAEIKWYDSVEGRMKESEQVSDRDNQFGDAAIHRDGSFFRYESVKDMHEDMPGNSEESGSLQYRFGGSEKEKAAQGFQQGLISVYSGAVNLPNKLPNIHINSNVRYLISDGADAVLNDPQDPSSRLSKSGALPEKSTGLNPAGVDTNDVLEMKKRMRQVQLEMTKLRAKQAEVTKEVQKVGNTPGSVSLKPRSQEEVDLHSVLVTNIHFAATKEIIATHFSNCGDIMRVTVLTDTVTGKPRGSAYVEFSSKDSVEKALNLNDSSLLSRTLKIGRKDAATESAVAPTVGRPSHGSPYPSVRAHGKFLRGSPLNLRRPASIARPFHGTSHLQWKRETSSPAGNNTSPIFGQTNSQNIPSSGRVAALRSPTSLIGDRYGLGPIRMSRSMSYVRPAPYPSR